MIKFFWIRKYGWIWRQKDWIKGWWLWWWSPAGEPMSPYQVQAWNMTLSLMGENHRSTDLLILLLLLVYPCNFCFWVTFVCSCPNPADNTVQVMGNGRGSSTTFFFNAFQFTGKNRNVFLHCRVRLCVQRDNDCIPVGGPGLLATKLVQKHASLC